MPAKLKRQPLYTSPPEHAPLPRYPGGATAAGLLIAYVVVVLVVDTIATQRVQWPIAWDVWFRWNLRDYIKGLVADWNLSPNSLSFLLLYSLRELDLYKLIFWFLVPLLFTIPSMDWGAWGVRRWKRWDWGLLAFAGAAGLAAMFLIPHLPGVSELYRARGNLTAAEKAGAFLGYNVWTASWLPGWEFMHRYVLLAALAVFFPRGGRGWIIVPLLVAGSEGAYHLVKPPIEAAAMFGFGVAATAWAYQRSNFLLPMLAHWMIEVALVIFMVMLG